MSSDTLKTVSQVMQITYCVIGLIGNSISLVIFTKPSMRSSSVFLLIGLASFDTLVLIKGFISSLKVLGAIEYSNETFGMFFFRWACDTGTKYFTVVIAAERYFVVCHPILSMKWKNDSRGLILTISTLIFIVVVAAFSYVYYNWIREYKLIYQSVVLSFIPFTLVVIFSAGMAYGIHKFKQRQLGKSERRDLSATKMLLAVTGLFGICIFFEVTRRIMFFAGYNVDPRKGYYDYVINHLSDHFYSLNSTANFIIYGLMYNRFRDEFYKMFHIKTELTAESKTSQSQYGTLK